jgi:hypothetical protein
MAIALVLAGVRQDAQKILADAAIELARGLLENFILPRGKLDRPGVL